jgi:site-specific DNA recombinase
MRLQSTGLSMQERKTPCCKRSRARAAGWMRSPPAKTASFDEIAAAERLAERHVRRLVPLAFLSPKIIQAIADGTAPAGLTVSNLTEALPHAWTAQEQMLGLN